MAAGVVGMGRMDAEEKIKIAAFLEIRIKTCDVLFLCLAVTVLLSSPIYQEMEKLRLP